MHIDNNATELQHIPMELDVATNNLQSNIGRWVLAQYLDDPLAEVLHRRLQPLLAYPLPLLAVHDWLAVEPSVVVGFQASHR